MPFFAISALILEIDDEFVPKLDYTDRSHLIMIFIDSRLTHRLHLSLLHGCLRSDVWRRRPQRSPIAEGEAE